MSDRQETIELLWKQVLEGWDEEKRHTALISYCRENDVLGEAARRYRAVAEDSSAGAYRSSEQQRADAKKHLNAIIALAMATFEAQHPKTDPKAASKWIRALAVGVFLVVVLVLAFTLAGTPSGSD